ncbi:MAG: HEAT repeat domain-containing protein [Actinobacteria bacterium]|nr:HEAT repeat domain-containing protein [Actinomycetota bacterium]
MEVVEEAQQPPEGSTPSISPAVETVVSAGSAMPSGAPPIQQAEPQAPPARSEPAAPGQSEPPERPLPGIQVPAHQRESYMPSWYAITSARFDPDREPVEEDRGPGAIAPTGARQEAGLADVPPPPEAPRYEFDDGAPSGAGLKDGPSPAVMASLRSSPSPAPEPAAPSATDAEGLPPAAAADDEEPPAPTFEIPLEMVRDAGMTPGPGADLPERSIADAPAPSPWPQAAEVAEVAEVTQATEATEAAEVTEMAEVTEVADAEPEAGEGEYALAQEAGAQEHAPPADEAVAPEPPAGEGIAASSSGFPAAYEAQDFAEQDETDEIVAEPAVAGPEVAAALEVAEAELADEPVGDDETIEDEPAAADEAPVPDDRSFEVGMADVEEVAETAEVPEVAEVPQVPRVPEVGDVPEADGPMTPEAPASGDVVALSSTVVSDRRAALDRLAARGIGPEEAERVSALLLDPERDVRRAAAEALVPVADVVPADRIRRTLQDPIDDVRAAAVALAAARGQELIPDLLPLVGARRWPLTQAATLGALPGLLADRDLPDHELTQVLATVAALESSPIHAERAGFSALAAAIGRERLIEALGLPDDRRIGAARLLLEEGSGPSLLALAGRDTDPIEEVRYTANQASELLEQIERTGPPERLDAERGIPSAEAPSDEADVDMIAGLARVLHDPDESVRDRARLALSQVSRSAITRWSRQAIRSGNADQASLGARVAEMLGLSDLAPDVLERAADLPAESRAAFMGALASFRLEAAALVDLVAEVDPSRRQEAIRLLWQVAGRAVLPHLRDSLTDSSGPVRMAVLEVFGESGDPAALEVAHSVLEMDSSPAVRATAIQVMGRAGLEQRVASLAQALTDPDPDVRSTAVEVLPQGMGRHAAQLLLKALGDHDERVWTAAIRHLVMLPERDLPIVWSALRQCPARQRDQLISQLERTSVEKLALLALEHVDSPEYAERVLAVELAGRAGTLECSHAAIGALQDPHPAVRRIAAAALSGLRSPAAVPALGKALNDPDAEVRVEAVRALGVVDDDAVLSFLVSALKDPELRVREEASDALTRWSSPTVARRLAEVLTSPDLRRPATELLARMGSAAVEPLLDVLDQGDPEIGPTVGELLDRIAGPEAFLERLTSMDPAQRMRAVAALGTIGGARAVEGLVRTLSDPDERIRARAVRLLGEMGDPRAFEAVKRAFMGDPVAEVVTAAEEALRRLQPDHDEHA